MIQYVVLLYWGARYLPGRISRPTFAVGGTATKRKTTAETSTETFLGQTTHLQTQTHTAYLHPPRSEFHPIVFALARNKSSHFRIQLSESCVQSKGEREGMGGSRSLKAYRLPRPQSRCSKNRMIGYREEKVRARKPRQAKKRGAC